MSDLQKINAELQQMRNEVKGTVDINYERYNTNFMGKVEQFNQLRKQSIKVNNDAELRKVAQDGSAFLHHKARGRTIHLLSK
jgi:hypothetical protein